MSERDSISHVIDKHQTYEGAWKPICVNSFRTDAVTSVTKGRTHKLPKIFTIVETYGPDHSLENSGHCVMGLDLCFGMMRKYAMVVDDVAAHVNTKHLYDETMCHSARIGVKTLK
jgi:hypothetical protein